MNLNELAKQITLREGLKKSISIAQVKEVLRIIKEIYPAIFDFLELHEAVKKNLYHPNPAINRILKPKRAKRAKK